MGARHRPNCAFEITRAQVTSRSSRSILTGPSDLVCPGVRASSAGSMAKGDSSPPDARPARRHSPWTAWNPSHATAGTSTPALARHRSPPPRPTARGPLHEGTRRHTRRRSPRRGAPVRGRPSRRARWPGEPRVKPLQMYRSRFRALRTDSCQTHPLSRHARATRSIAIRYAASRSDTCSPPARSCTAAEAAVIHVSSLWSTSSALQ